MSDLKLLNIKTNKLIKKQRIAKHDLKSLIEANTEDLLVIKIIYKNYDLLGTNDLVEVLGYDENLQLVVLEYRMGKFTNTVNKGLIYLDYIKNNSSKLKADINGKLGYKISNSLRFEPRLIVIGDDFNKYDEYAIKQMPYIIDLVKYQVYDNKFLLLEKNYQSTNIDTGSKPIVFKNKDDYNIYKAISQFVLSLGDEVCEVNDNNYISYRKISNFMYLMYEEGIEIKLKKKTNYKTIKIKNIKDFEKVQIDIEACYDEN